MLGFLGTREDPGLLVGLEPPDDAAVYRVAEDQAIVATVDFFPPLVDGPEDFGAIAAANSLSDLYAMGARPLFALSILAIQLSELGPETVSLILHGASEKSAEAGITIAGGHSIDDPEPKFGLVAVGILHPDRVWRKVGARPGDAIVLGKALGTGVITTGIKRGIAPEEAAAAAVRSMRQLNRAAAKTLAPFEVHAATDVTGFGLLGHLMEVCRASGVAAEISAAGPALLPGALELAAQGCRPDGTDRNQRSLEGDVSWADSVEGPLRLLFVDAQTSGGLLAFLPEGEGHDAASALRDAGYAAAVVGAIQAGHPYVTVTA